MDVDAMVEAVYDAVDDEDGLQRLGARLADQMGAVSAMLIESDPAEPPRVVQWAQPPEALALYREHYRLVDPWVAASPRAGFDRAVSVDRLVPWSDLKGGEFYNDYLRPWGDMAHCLGLAVSAGEGAAAVLSLQRSRAQGAFEVADERALQALAPHLTRLARTRRRARRRNGEAADLQLMLDSRTDALFLLAGDGRLLHANAAGSALLARPDGPFRLAAGRLAPRDAADERAWREALAGAARSAAPVCSPVPLADARWAAALDLADAAAARAVLAVRNLPARRRRRAQDAAARFGLTGAEAALLQSLLDGLTLEQHALARGVSVATARTQLRAVAAKTDTSRQAELLERATALPSD